MLAYQIKLSQFSIMWHYQKLYQELGLESLKDRRWLRYLCYLYKMLIIIIMVIIYIKYFLPSKGFSVTQVASKFLRCWTELLENSFLQFIITEWNKLDPGVRNVDTYSLFCKNLLALIKPIENSVCSIYDPFGTKLLHRLQIGFSCFWEHKYCYVHVF